jgi:hypothetical protein
VKRTVVLLSLALGLAAVGCRERQSLTSPHRLSADFSDGRVASGNPHFFFLPPIIGQPTFSGILNPNLAPVVEICQLDVDPNNIPLGCNATALPINPGPVQLDGTSQQYQVDWHTDAPAINPALFYRIQVFSSIQAFSSGTKPLGFADVDPVANGSQLKNVNTGEYIGLVDGRTLPIKFRIEQGATCFGQTDCVEQTLGPSTSEQHVVTSTGFAGVSFPAGYFTQTVTLTIHRVPEPCLNTPFQQFEGCYSFATSPLAGDALGCLVTPTDPSKCARVEVCLITSTDDSRRAHTALFRSDPGLPATELPEAANGLITCTLFGPFPTIGLGPHGIADLARASWHSMRSALGRLLEPEPLFARSAMAHLGLGGLTCCFSNFAWALPLQMTGPLIAPTGLAGSAPVRDSVLVQYTHGIEPPTPAQGIVVTFTPTQGTVSPSSVTTNSSGYAITQWTLVPGTNTLVATAAATGSPLSLTATGTTLGLNTPGTNVLAVTTAAARSPDPIHAMGTSLR